MFFQKSLFSLLVVVVFGVYFFQIVHSIPVTAGDIGPGVYHAGVIGNYAGQISGGKATIKLQPNAILDHFKHDDDENYHDFSENAAENDPSHYESVGSYGDHLEESHFPADYGKDDQNGEEYAEAEAESAASEHHEDYEQHAELDEHDYQAHELKADENEIDIGAHFHDDGHDDFYSKPVPGIDHGKGAFSYSTTYEFKDPKE